MEQVEPTVGWARFYGQKRTCRRLARALCRQSYTGCGRRGPGRLQTDGPSGAFGDRTL